MQILKLRKEDLKRAYEVLKELRTTLEYEEFIETLEIMQDKQNYTMFGLWDKGEIQSYAGVEIQTNLYWKRHLFIHDLVTKSSSRDNGYGKQMIDFLNDYAKMHKCENIALTSGSQRKDAHRFYEREGFDKPGFVFLKYLDIKKD